MGVQVGAEDAGSDGVDGDAFPGPLNGKRAGEGGDAGLTRRVGGHFAESNETVERCDVDDATVAAIEHVLAEDLAGAQRAGEIGIEDAGPLFFREGERWRAPDSSGAVDEDINLAEAAEGGGEQFFERSAVANIGGHANSLTAAGLDEVGGFFHLGLTACGGDDVGAGVGEPKTECAADTGGSSSNYCGFTFKG